MSETPKVIWAVADMRRGVENQAVGLAEAVARQIGNAVIARVTIRDDSFVTLPEQDMPDVWIGCGRPALKLARRHRKIFPAARFVYVQDPRNHYDRFDLIVAPGHDRVRKPNAISMIGSPHRVTPDRLAEGKAAFTKQLAALPAPRAAREGLRAVL
jgi:mitochondrial fission protein ELM1